MKKVHSTGGILSHQDLEHYRVKVMPALQGTYRGRTVYTTHAPTSGPVLLHMLNLMEHYDALIEEGRTLENMHRYIEAMKCKLILHCARYAKLTYHVVQSASRHGESNILTVMKEVSRVISM